MRLLSGPALALIALCIMSSHAANVAAQETQADQVAVAIGRVWDPASRLPDDRCFKLRWTIENRRVPDAQTLQALRAEVRRNPDHPERNNLAAYEARLGGRFDVAEMVWWNDPGQRVCRLNRTYTGAHATEYFDRGIGKEVQWGLGPTQLLVVSVKAPEPSYDYASMLPMEYAHLYWALSGGLWTGFANSLPLPSVRVSANTWTASSRDAARGLTLEASGEWNAATGALIPRSVRIERKLGERGDWETTYRSSGQRYIEALDLWIPERIECWRGSPPRLDLVYTVHEFEFVDASVVAALVALTDFNGADPIRGASTFTSILDLRPGRQGYDIQSPEGVRHVPLSTTPAARHQARLQLYGWISAAAMVAALAALRLRRQVLYPTRTGGRL